MGVVASKEQDRISQLEKKQEAMMREHAEMAKRLAEEQERNKKQSEDHVAQMAQLMLLLVVAANEHDTTGRKASNQLEIDGVQYNVIEKLGEGGFGQVFKAQAVGSRRVVAIKAMPNSPLIQKEIKNEIRFMQATKKVRITPHPVIEYYGCKITDDAIFIAMELAETDLLKFWFQDMQGKSPEEKFAFGLIIVMYTLRALTFLEKINIVHGDIKPQNLVLVQSGGSIAIKLIDFGTVEKMNTMRSVMTVDAGKAHTMFFASPEFLKRDSHHIIARRLHKKSDAWAAGVMFYILFMGKWPWEDESDYENFVNDPNATDVVVPAVGGYKLIIELLLKKNPEERASAKETLLQVKAHPVLGVIATSIEESFYPADDVCNIHISDELREELASFAPERRRAVMLDSTSSGTSTRSGATARSGRGRTRRSCRYGRECYRKNPDHREEFAHPGDPDYREEGARAKVPCRYGSQCYRKGNADHLARYSHN